MINDNLKNKQCENFDTSCEYENNYKSEQFSPDDVIKVSSPKNLSMSDNNDGRVKLNNLMFENYSCSQKDSVAKLLELKPNLEEAFHGFNEVRKSVQEESLYDIERKSQNNELLFGLNLKSNLHKSYSSFIDNTKPILDNLKNIQPAFSLNLNLKPNTNQEPLFGTEDKVNQQELNLNRTVHLPELDLAKPNSVLQEPSYDFNLNRKPSSVLGEPKTDLNICDQLNLTIEQQQELSSIKLQNIDSQQSEEEDEDNNIKEQDANFAKQFNIFPAIFSRQLNFSQQQNNYNLNSTPTSGIPTPPQSQHNLNFNLNQYSTNFNYHHNMNNYYQEKMDELNTTRNLSLLGSMSGLLDEHLHTNFHGNLQNLHTNFHGNLQNLHSNLHHHHHHHHQTEMKFMPVLQDTR